MKLEKYFVKENTDPKGHERQCQRSSEGRADIHIDLLDISEEFGLPVDQKKVEKLAKDMFLRVDPTQLVLTVVPDDPESFCFERAEESLFKVVHGRHRY